MKRTYPSWLQPTVDVVPDKPASVWGRMGNAVLRAKLTPKEYDEMVARRLAARHASMTPERRSEIARKAAFARQAKMTAEERLALGKIAGAASIAARTPAQKRKYARMAGIATARATAERKAADPEGFAAECRLRGLKGAASRSPEYRSDISRRAAATKRAQREAARK